MLHTGFFKLYSSSSNSSSVQEKIDAQMLAVAGVAELCEVDVRHSELTAEDLLGLLVRLWEAVQDEALVPAQLRVQLLLH